MEMLRTESVTFKFVILAPRDGRLKYVGRYYNPRRDYGYTVKANGALELIRKKRQEKLWKDLD